HRDADRRIVIDNRNNRRLGQACLLGAGRRDLELQPITSVSPPLFNFSHSRIPSLAASFESPSLVSIKLRGLHAEIGDEPIWSKSHLAKVGLKNHIKSIRPCLRQHPSASSLLFNKV